MKKFYGHTLLYLHETISLGAGRWGHSPRMGPRGSWGRGAHPAEGQGDDRFTSVFGEVYHPMMADLGARLFAMWETTPYNGRWPQVTIIWEIDAFSDYARIGRAQAPGGSHAAAAATWSAFLAEIRASGEGRIMYAGKFNRTLAQLTQADFGASLVIQEIMQTKPGRQDDYIRELERLYVPWSERTGKRWLGSFITTFRFDEVIHYWALDGDWDCFENHYPSWKDSPPAEIVTWMSVAPALRDGWEDSILQALPPSPLQ
ncbi:MAG TPA: NIPSNAP family protein [Mycobacterium sp.]